MSHNDSAHHEETGPYHVHQHVCPMSLLIGILVALLILTGLTVFTAEEIHMGEWNLVAALIIAFVKGSLVVLFFMHMFWEKPYNALALITALLFVTLFISISCMDSFAYENNVNLYHSANPAMLDNNVIKMAKEAMTEPAKPLPKPAPSAAPVHQAPAAQQAQPPASKPSP